MKKIFGVLSIIMCVFVVGCGKNSKPVADDIIKRDITANEELSIENKVEVSGFEITERYTRVEDGIDEILGKYYLQNDLIYIEGTFDFAYELYDDGWKLIGNEMNLDRSSLVVSELDEERVVNDAMDEGYNEVELVEKMEDENGYCEYRLSSVERYEYLSVKKFFEISYNFNLEKMEYIRESEYHVVEEKPILDICGSYERYTRGDELYPEEWCKNEITISDYDEETNTFTLDYDVSGVSYISWNPTPYHYKNTVRMQFENVRTERRMDEAWYCCSAYLDDGGTELFLGVAAPYGVSFGVHNSDDWVNEYNEWYMEYNLVRRK